jgi:hypothetical protein
VSDPHQTGTFQTTLNIRISKAHKRTNIKINKQEIPCTTEARSTYFGCSGSNSRFLEVFITSMKFSIVREPSCLIFGIWDFGRIREQATCAADHGNVPLNFSCVKSFQTSTHMFNLRQRNISYA